MQYPLISEYLAAIRDAHDNLDKLSHLVPVLDNYGEPYRSSGAFAVVFKMKDEQTGKCYALKCFTEEQEGRAELGKKGYFCSVVSIMDFVRMRLYSMNGDVTINQLAHLLLEYARQKNAKDETIEWIKTCTTEFGL